MIVDEVEVARSLIGNRKAVDELKTTIASLEDLYLSDLRKELELLQGNEEFLKAELLQKMLTSGVKSLDCDGSMVTVSKRVTRKIVDDVMLSAEILSNMKAIQKLTGKPAKELKSQLFTMTLDKKALKELNVVDSLIDVEGVKLESVVDQATEYVTIK